MDKCKNNDNVVAVYAVNEKDCVFDDKGNLVRLKRKYKDKKRTVVKLK